ncbi:MAG: hypothetical protein KDI62_16500, partial [Anaerolineae bacterium]|nr:hypothetical protein [Anaerolineae bacterium]
MDNALNTLKQYPLWTGCKIPDKTPLNPHTGGNAQSNNPQTFGTFAQVEAAKARFGWTHIGFGFVPEVVEIMGIDIDKCVDEDGTIEPWAMEIIKRIDSYAEFSPSGQGVHILCYGVLPKNIGANDAPETCEMYDHGRWFTVTGDHVPGTPATIKRRGRQVLDLHADMEKRIEQHKRAQRPQPKPVATAVSTGRQEKYGQAAFESELATLASTGEGARNEQLFKSTAALRELANAGALDWATVEPALYDTALAIGLGEIETIKTIESAKKRVNGTVRDIPPLDSVRTDAHFQPSPQQDGPTQQRVEPALSEKNFWLSVEEITKKFFPREETGDAEVLAALYQRRIVYDHAEKKWYLWNGNHWVEDKKKRVITFLSSKVAAQYLHAAAEIKGRADNEADKAIAEEETKRLQKRASSLRFKTRIKNVLELASSVDTLALSGDEWETDPNLLAVENGIIDLKTGKFRPGQPEGYIRTFAPVEWKGLDAPAPRFEQFLQEIFAGDSELIRFVQRLLGHALLGQVYEHVLPIFWG